MISIYEEVVTMIATIAKVDKSRINEKTNLFEDLDMDSLIILDFVNQMEERWDFNRKRSIFSRLASSHFISHNDRR